MKVCHQAGSFRPQPSATLYCWHKNIWHRVNNDRLSVVGLRFTKESRYNMGNANQFDWRKLYGTKSGWKTATNKELILAYRYIPALDYFEVGFYYRLPNLGFEVFDIVEMEIGETRYFEVPLRNFWPVAPWAGGDQKPTGPNSFLMDVAKSESNIRL